MECEGINMIEYTKIPAIFKRDTEGSKKLIEGAFCDETVEYLKNNVWVCTEKIDGTNIGIVWNGHEVTFQGRTERAQIPNHLFDKLTELFKGDEAEELFEQKFGSMSVILFGEGYGNKIQNGDKYRDDVSFILFDVYLPDKRLWLKRDAVEDIARTFGIEIVPTIVEGTLSDAVEYVKSRPKSTIGCADMEGLVCKPKQEVLDRQGKRVIVKVKVCDLCENERGRK